MQPEDRKFFLSVLAVLVALVTMFPAWNWEIRQGASIYRKNLKYDLLWRPVSPISEDKYIRTFPTVNLSMLTLHYVLALAVAYAATAARRSLKAD